MAKGYELAFDLPEVQDEDIRENEQAAAGDHGVSIKAAAGWGVLITVVLALMAALIYGKVRISALYTQRAELEAQLAQLHSDNISLQSELAEKTNMTKVDEYAKNELGLQKLEKAQIEYIEVEMPSVAEVKESGGDGVFDRLRAWFDSFEEYISP